MTDGADGNKNKLRAITLDDEYVSLQQFEYLTNDIKELEIINTFTDPQKALEYMMANSEKIDIAFLDIEMPAMNGLTITRGN
ncbi:response regulator [Natranaerofaba carboxydovora]|uniref:response regulator n=1 Tax=Natranaerofaba carboxydovora TaxID=2742683 RepID=UPI001F130ADB|nr:response regulator [Natranaerofaba carboxydovora]UMZ73521.1 Transcriptional regulatory protein YpdB [Natranaerofaba carboxydovora]